MRTKIAVRIILVAVGVIAVSVGGYSIYHYGQVAPVLHNKQPADVSSASLAQQADTSDVPSATPLQVVAVEPSGSQYANSAATPSPDAQASPSSSSPKSKTASAGGQSAASPQLPTFSLQTQPVLGAVQGVAGGGLNGAGINLQL